MYSFEVGAGIGPAIGGATSPLSPLNWSSNGPPQKKSPGKKSPRRRPRWWNRANDRWKLECGEAETPPLGPPKAWSEARASAMPRDIRKAAHSLYIMARLLIRNI